MESNQIKNEQNEATTGFCDICGKRETSSKANLQQGGWHIGQREHFCPNCND